MRICGSIQRGAIRRCHDAEPASPHRVPAEFRLPRRIERSSSRARSGLTGRSRPRDLQRQPDLLRIASDYGSGWPVKYRRVVLARSAIPWSRQKARPREWDPAQAILGTAKTLLGNIQAGRIWLARRSKFRAPETAA